MLDVAQSDESGCGLLIAGAVMFFIFAPASWTNAVWYGIEYGISPSKVESDPKPKDCDFIHSPVGDKGCKYTAYVRAFNAVDEAVGGDDAPKYGRDTNTNKPIVSYDGGKSWQWYSESSALPDPKVASVRVFWTKVTTD